MCSLCVAPVALGAVAMPNENVAKSVQLAFPTCSQCAEADRVRALLIRGVDPEVHYWQCDRCGLVWATRDGEQESP
jgi:hypothetical protein